MIESNGFDARRHVAVTVLEGGLCEEPVESALSAGGDGDEGNETAGEPEAG